MAHGRQQYRGTTISGSTPLAGMASTQTHPHKDTHTMPTTYEESVLDCADEYGNLSLRGAEQLFKHHGSDYWDAHKQGMELTLKAHKLLTWLGY